MKPLPKTDEYRAQIESIVTHPKKIQFPQDVEKESLAIPDTIPDEEYEKRKDFRRVATFTIDPDDAKDYDDALSVEFLDNEDVVVGVHIADVSHYVIQKTALDEEAYKRGTSIYLVGTVIPMLPEHLSNNLCSLKEGVDRLTMSTVFTLSKDGVIKNVWYGESVIHSKKRFTYENAQKILDAGHGVFHKELFFINSYAKKLLKARIASGSLMLEDTEVKFILNAHGHPIDVVKKVRQDTNKMIEEWMLLANKTIAHLYRDNKESGVFCFRIHDKPDKEKLIQFLTMLMHKKIKVSKAPSSKELNELLSRLKNTPQYEFFNRILTRTLAKAIYSTKNKGHYGLAFKEYTHFTSPIRRYPDLMVHRMVKNTVSGEKIHLKETKDYEHKLQYLSEMERQATDAERLSIKHKQVLYMKDRVGQIFKGIVTGITEKGIYVSEEKSKSEGMVSLWSMDKDYFYNEKTLEYTSKKLGPIHIGSEVRIKVQKVNTEKKFIDYILV